MSRYILSLDQGTTSSRAILFDAEQNIVGLAQKEFTQYYPRQGWVEHDPMEIYASQYAVMSEVITQNDVDVRDIAAIGVTNQRETTILWERDTGRPIYNAIVWQCRRTADMIGELLDRGLGRPYGKKPGSFPTPIFPGQRSNGSLTTCRARASAPSGGRSCSGRSTAG